jgi:hypothetical protein
MDPVRFDSLVKLLSTAGTAAASCGFSLRCRWAWPLAPWLMTARGPRLKTTTTAAPIAAVGARRAMRGSPGTTRTTARGSARARSRARAAPPSRAPGPAPAAAVPSSIHAARSSNATRAPVPRAATRSVRPAIRPPGSATRPPTAPPAMTATPAPRPAPARAGSVWAAVRWSVRRRTSARLPAPVILSRAARRQRTRAMAPRARMGSAAVGSARNAVPTSTARAASATGIRSALRRSARKRNVPSPAGRFAAGTSPRVSHASATRAPITAAFSAPRRDPSRVVGREHVSTLPRSVLRVVGRSASLIPSALYRASGQPEQKAGAGVRT